jgi:dipeptidyl aminopeptidase/acylaminoacyl peptidase
MKILRIIGALAALTGPGLAVAQRVTVDDLMQLRSLSDVRIAPDGKHIVYVVTTPSFESDAHEGALYIVGTVDRAPIHLAAGTRIFNRPVPVPHLRWSPDGRLVSFVGFSTDVPQVMVVSPEGGEAKPITSLRQGVTNYEWAPDGTRIAFIAPDSVPSDEQQRKKNKSYVMVVGQDQRGPRLWVQDVAPGSVPRAISPPGEVVVDFSWAPTGQIIAYSASREIGFTSIYGTRVFTVPITGGEPRPIVDRPGTNRAAQFSPDGRWIAFISSGGVNGMISAQDLHVVAADGRSDTIRNLTASQEAWIGEFVWAPDSRSILYVPTEQTNVSGEHMFEQPVNRVTLADHRVTLVTPGPVVIFSLSMSRDGSTIAYKSVGARTMGDVATMDLATGRTNQLTDIDPELRRWALGNLEPVHWRSFDGQEIWGLLLTPPGYQAGRRLPLVVYCHGGPIGGFTLGIFPQFMHRAGQVDPYPVEAMASAGIAILFPMPRGGSGYGVAGFRAIIQRWGEDDYKDIMAGVDTMIARGIADPDRLGVMGASYGGYMTNWVVTQTSRFVAASAAASVSDLAQMYYQSEGGDFVVEYFGYPWQDGPALMAHSPITYVTRVTTPLLIQHGQEDPRVPVGQAIEFYRALKALHKTAELDIYPRGGHVNVEPALEREYMRRNYDWFIKWLKPGPVATNQ